MQPEFESTNEVRIEIKIIKYTVMARVCQVTGKKRMIGNNVSHSKRRTKREFAVNLRMKKFWLESEKRFVTLKVSAAGMRNINKNGLEAELKKAVNNGYIDIV